MKRTNFQARKKASSRKKQNDCIWSSVATYLSRYGYNADLVIRSFSECQLMCLVPRATLLSISCEMHFWGSIIGPSGIGDDDIEGLDVGRDRSPTADIYTRTVTYWAQLQPGEAYFYTPLGIKISQLRKKGASRLSWRRSSHRYYIRSLATMVLLLLRDFITLQAVFQAIRTQETVWLEGVCRSCGSCNLARSFDKKLCWRPFSLIKGSIASCRR